MSNDTLCRWLGYSEDEFAEMSWTEFTHPDDVAANVEMVRRLVAGEVQTSTLEKRFIAKDGTLSGRGSLPRCCFRRPRRTPI